MRITREQFDNWMAGYGDPMEPKVWKEGTAIIMGYVAQLEEQIQFKGGAQRLPFDIDEAHI